MNAFSETARTDGVWRCDEIAPRVTDGIDDVIQVIEGAVGQPVGVEA